MVCKDVRFLSFFRQTVTMAAAALALILLISLCDVSLATERPPSDSRGR